MSSALVPMYVSEIAPVNLRGGVGIVNQLAVTIGMLLSQVRYDDQRRLSIDFSEVDMLRDVLF